MSRMLRTITTGALIALSASASATDDGGREARLADFDACCRFVAEAYADFERTRTVCTTYRPRADVAARSAAFIDVVEDTLAERHDPTPTPARARGRRGD